MRPMCPVATRGLPVVDAHPNNQIGTIHPGEPEVVLLEAEGGPVVPAPPVKNPLGAPGIDHPGAQSVSQRLQARHLPGGHHAGAGEDDDPAGGVDPVDNRVQVGKPWVTVAAFSRALFLKPRRVGIYAQPELSSTVPYGGPDTTGQTGGVSPVVHIDQL